jgi:uncharacterized protein (TIGR01777 family)
MRVIVTGSHGLIGRELAASLERDGHEVTRLVRGIPRQGEAGWDIKEGWIDARALEGHDAAVHLAGAGLGDHRWTHKYKREIITSRVQSGMLLARTLAGLDAKPRVWVSGSAVGYYGDRGDEEMTEADGPGAGFLAEVCRQWEAATIPAEDAGIRVAHARTGIVQSGKGGSLEKLRLPFKLGVGGRFGSGRQWLSWISLDDEVAAIRHVLEHEELRGPVNVTAPHPVTVQEYVAAVGRALHRPALLPVPTLALDVILGREMAQEMLLGGQRVLPQKLLESGFTFRHPDLDLALRDALAAA